MYRMALKGGVSQRLADILELCRVRHITSGMKDGAERVVTRRKKSRATHGDSADLTEERQRMARSEG